MNSKISETNEKRKIRKNQNSKEERDNNQVVQAKVHKNLYKSRNLKKQL